MMLTFTQSISEVKNAWTNTSTPQYTFIVWHRIKHNKEFPLSSLTFGMYPSFSNNYSCLSQGCLFQAQLNVWLDTWCLKKYMTERER